MRPSKRFSMEAREEDAKLITVYGSMSNVFKNAIDVAMSNRAPAEQKDEISKLVAVEAAEESRDIISSISKKMTGDYLLNKEEFSREIGLGNILVDVHDVSNPNSDQVTEAAQIIEQVEKGKLRQDEYIPVFVYTAAPPDQEGDGRPTRVMKPYMFAGLESLCNKAGIKVCHMVRTK